MSGIESQTATAVKQAAPLERIYDKVNAHNNRMNEMVSALTNVMDRMVGSISSSVPDKAAEVASSTSISKINGALGDQGTLLTQLHDQIQRVAEL